MNCLEQNKKSNFKICNKLDAFGKILLSHCPEKQSKTLIGPWCNHIVYMRKSKKSFYNKNTDMTRPN